MLSATNAVGQKKDSLWAKVAARDFSSKLRKSNSLGAAIFATKKQDRTNVEIVSCGCCNQGLGGAFHSQMGKTSLLGREGCMWLK